MSDWNTYLRPIQIHPLTTQKIIMNTEDIYKKWAQAPDKEYDCENYGTDVTYWQLLSLIEIARESPHDEGKAFEEKVSQRIEEMIKAGTLIRGVKLTCPVCNIRQIGIPQERYSAEYAYLCFECGGKTEPTEYNRG